MADKAKLVSNTKIYLDTRLLSTAYVVIVEQDKAGNYIITLNQ